RHTSSKRDWSSDVCSPDLETLDRAPDGHGPIASLTFQEVGRIRIAGREPIPTLREVLSTLRDAYFNIDAKSDDAVGPLIDVLRDLDAFDRVCVTSFSDRRIGAIRQASPAALTTAASPREVRSLALRSALRRLPGVSSRPPAADAAQVPMRHRGLPVVTQRFIESTHAA